MYHLTQREAEVFHLLVSGYSDKEIASELRISWATVRTHVEHVLMKCNVKRRRDLAKVVDLVRSA
jgi:DNA-binding NarL/FixJ family response regulator